jgi:hypothetical protein
MARSTAFFIALMPGLLSLACGSNDDGTAAPETPGATPAFSLDEGTLRLEPGQQGLFCRQMPVPDEYRESEYFVTGVEADVSLGTHHLIVTASDVDVQQAPPLCLDTGSGQASAGSNFQDFAVDPNPSSVFETLKRVAFGGGGGGASIHFPKGYGKPMPKGFFESSHHVLNTGSQARDIHGRFDVFAAPAEAIEFPMGVLFANALTIDVAPNAEGSVEGTMTVPEALDLVVLNSHAHNFLVRFEMFLYRNGAASAEPIYVSEDWESPAIEVLDPPLHLEAGDGVTFRCSYQNTTSEKIGWGVVGGEMCMPFVMYAYPAGTTRRVPPTMSAIVTTPAPAMLELGTGAFGG